MITLGIELSTQSVKCVVLDLEPGEIVHIGSISYDSAFPEYGTHGGVLSSECPGVRHTSPLMLMEALDAILENLVNEKVDLTRVRVVKVDGMQHCTVFTNPLLTDMLTSLTPDRPLASQLGSCLSRQTAPIWEDRSTAQEAAVLTDVLKDQGGIAELTGNRAELRFPAAQIMKWAAESPGEYDQTSRVWILSAFITTLLTGKPAPVDTGDGWGTNLNHLNIEQPGWNAVVLSAVDSTLGSLGVKSTLKSKLGEMTHYDGIVGHVSPYFIERYGINPQALVLAGTGDNPATLLGCGGRLVISLGSSYTVNGVMDNITPSLSGDYNIFGYSPGNAMALSVITNGSKVHDHFLTSYFPGIDATSSTAENWQKYMSAAGDLLLTGNEKLMLPYLMDESIPLRKIGIHREGFSEEEASANIRALHLSQVLSLKCHADHIGDPDEICVVGGAAKNHILRQWIADAFNAETYTISGADVAAPMGCAISGAKVALDISYQEATRRFVKKDLQSVCRPRSENVAVLRQLEQRYADLEDKGIRVRIQATS